MPGTTLSNWVYITNLLLELVEETFRNHPGTEDVTIDGKEHRISQFANNATMFMSFNEEILRRRMDILNKFHTISGLKINLEKTKVIKFKKLRHSRITLCEDMNLIWTNTFTSLGIDYDMNNLDKITAINLKTKLLKIQ